MAGKLLSLPFHVLRDIAHYSSRYPDELIFSCEVDVAGPAYGGVVATERLFWDEGWGSSRGYRVLCDGRCGDAVYVVGQGLTTHMSWGTQVGRVEDLCMPTALWSVNRYTNSNRLYAPGVLLPGATTILAGNDVIAIQLTVARKRPHDGAPALPGAED